MSKKDLAWGRKVSMFDTKYRGLKCLLDMSINAKDRNKDLHTIIK